MFSNFLNDFNKALVIISCLLFIFPSHSQTMEVEDNNDLHSAQARAVSIDRLLLQLYTVENINNGRNAHDGIGILFNESYNDGFDNSDALKPTNMYENFARILEGRRISLEKRKNPVPGLVLELYIGGYTQTEYAFLPNIVGLEAYDIFIDDAFTGQNHLLIENEFVYFNLTTQASRASDRFQLRFELKENTFLYQNGNWNPMEPGGISGMNDNISVINGTAALNDVTNIKNIRINQAGNLDVYGILNLYGDIQIEGNLTFKSTASGNGELGYISDNSQISGEVTVENYMKNRRSYRMLSSSVTTSESIRANLQEGAVNNLDDPNPGYGTHITGSTEDGYNGFDGTISGNPSMFTLDAANRTWIPVDNTNEDNLSAGEPYLLFVRGHRGIDLTNNASQDSTILRTTGTIHIGQHQQNFPAFDSGTFVMFGNPYVSTVDVNTVFSTSENVNPYFCYFYDPSIGNNGGYVTVSLPEGENNVGSLVNQFLQPGQAAQFTVLDRGTSSVVFTENAKAPGNFTGGSSTGNEFLSESSLKMKLFTATNYHSDKQAHDGFVILFNDDYQNEITPQDAFKPMNFSENIAINNQETYLSIERRKMPVPSEVFQIYSDGYKQNSYVLSIEMEGWSDLSLFLDDAFTGNSTPLENGETNYPFSIDENPLSRASDRFSIRVESNLGIRENIFTHMRLFPNPTNTDTFFIHAPKITGEQVVVSIRDLAGREIYSKNFSANSNKLTVVMDDVPASGIYLVTLRVNGESNTFRLIKN